MKIATSIDLILIKKDKILLGELTDKWTNNKEYRWGLPGREINFGENFREAVKNNLKEELGMKLKRFRIICINNNFEFQNHYISIGILVQGNGNPKIMKPKDWKSWRWFEKNKLPKKIFPSGKLTLKCFLKNKVSI